MIVLVEIITPIVNRQVYVIIVMHIYFLKEKLLMMEQEPTMQQGLQVKIINKQYLITLHRLQTVKLK